jgi:hypothetical protein
MTFYAVTAVPLRLVRAAAAACTASIRQGRARSWRQRLKHTTSGRPAEVAVAAAASTAASPSTATGNAVFTREFIDFCDYLRSLATDASAVVGDRVDHEVFGTYARRLRAVARELTAIEGGLRLTAIALPVLEGDNEGRPDLRLDANPQGKAGRT